MDLNRQTVGLQAPFAGEAFGNGCEHFQQQTRHIGVFGGAGVLLVHQTRAIQGQRQGAFAIGFLGQQHALDVGVFNDAHLRAAGIFAPGPGGPALRAVLGVIQAGVVTRHAQHGGRHTHANAGFVHHVEHAAQAFAGPAHQVGHGAAALAVQACARCRSHWVLALAKVEQRVGGATPAAFVVEARQRHVVALAGELPVNTHQLFGHDEQRNAFHARHQLARRVGDFGQHQMDDVLGEFVLTRRNPHLVAAQPVTRAQSVRFKTFPVRRGAGRDVAQRRARLGLTQTHGARKPT